MNILYPLRYDKSYYWTGEEHRIPNLLDIIAGKSDDEAYKLFKFHTKSVNEKRLFFYIYNDYIKDFSRSHPSDKYVIWLVDSPCMTHLIVHEIVEAELMGYNNIIMLGEKNVGPEFFEPTINITPLANTIRDLQAQRKIGSLITPCLNKTHNRLLDQIDIRKIGIQHGYGTWIEKKMLEHVHHHYNYGEISYEEFDNPKTVIAGYSPTKFFDLYPFDDEGYILYLSQGPQFTNRKNIIENLELLRLQDDFGLPIVIKEHKSATGEFHGTVERVYGEGEANTEELIRKSSITITSWSGAGVEALFLNKPTIILDTQNDKGKFYKDSGLVVSMNYEALKSRVGYFLDGRIINAQAFKSQINYQAGEAASSIILSCAA